jgi:PPOX class probable F420-dependent enzyme
MPFEDLAGETYISLTTFRRDGRAVATPVQFVRDGDRLLVNTGARSGKVKRIRHTPKGTIAPCDMRGRLKSDAAPIPVAISFLDATSYDDARRKMLAASGGFMRTMWRLTETYRRFRGRLDDRIWLELRPA